MPHACFSDTKGLILSPKLHVQLFNYIISLLLHLWTQVLACVIQVRLAIIIVSSGLKREFIRESKSTRTHGYIGIYLIIRRETSRFFKSWQWTVNDFFWSKYLISTHSLWTNEAGNANNFKAKISPETIRIDTFRNTLLLMFIVDCYWIINVACDSQYKMLVQMLSKAHDQIANYTPT